MPNQGNCTKTMPQYLQTMYKNTQVIIDCSEIFIEIPSSTRSQSTTDSHYKHNTAQGFIGIAPSGMATFVLDHYSRGTSNKDATKDCGTI